MLKYTLRYFDGRARAEVIRLLLTIQGIAFEDKRVSFESWPAEKLNTPFGLLPVLTIDGQDLTESVAIERYLAREFGMFGSTNMEGYEIDQIIGMRLDLMDQVYKQSSEKDEERKAQMGKTLKEETIPKVIGNIEKLVSRNQEGHCIGQKAQMGKTNGNIEKDYCTKKKLSLADLVIFDLTDGRLDGKALEKFPYVKAIVDNVKANGKIKAYLSKRKPTDF